MRLLQMVVRTIAEGGPLAGAATAQVFGFFLRYGKFDRRNIRPRMGTIAERLILGATTGTPVIVTRRQLHRIRALLCTYCFSHLSIL